jgi:hypothetical protein
VSCRSPSQEGGRESINKRGTMHNTEFQSRLPVYQAKRSKDFPKVARSSSLSASGLGRSA